MKTRGNVIWNGVGNGQSSFGHVSTNINGDNFSWAPNGWDKKYPNAEEYNNAQRNFRDGTGYLLNLTPSEEQALQACLSSRKDNYSVINNNCANPVQECLLERVHIPRTRVFPSYFGSDLANSPALISTIPYPK
jgi:hypothetical protein